MSEEASCLNAIMPVRIAGGRHNASIVKRPGVRSLKVTGFEASSDPFATSGLPLAALPWVRGQRRQQARQRYPRAATPSLPVGTPWLSWDPSDYTRGERLGLWSPCSRKHRTGALCEGGRHREPRSRGCRGAGKGHPRHRRDRLRPRRRAGDWGRRPLVGRRGADGKWPRAAGGGASVLRRQRLPPAHLQLTAGPCPNCSAEAAVHQFVGAEHDRELSAALHQTQGVAAAGDGGAVEMDPREHGERSQAETGVTNGIGQTVLSPPCFAADARREGATAITPFCP